MNVLKSSYLCWTVSYSSTVSMFQSQRLFVSHDPQIHPYFQKPEHPDIYTLNLVHRSYDPLLVKSHGRLKVSFYSYLAWERHSHLPPQSKSPSLDLKLQCCYSFSRATYSSLMTSSSISLTFWGQFALHVAGKISSR